ncbi:peptide ABC transporter [Microbacterium faecale]|uniref:Peptide ABC transporter n=1 Tax=Microbacterium faecale TaxID=1804630 RepID=A0A916YF71_9MICO|nr:ABC transporter permease [Microbacterium faecale]GGD42971.1 peptide ABC transporter [Microbacterium faecale]
MLRQIGIRLLRLVPVLLLITLLATAALDLMPGSPALAMLGDDASPEQVRELTRRLGLDQPFPVRYVEWIGAAVQGDLGESLRMGIPVSEAIAQRFPVTFQIALMAIIIAAALAVPTALFSGANVGGRLDRVATATSSGLLSLPSFAAAVILIYIFGLQLRILPVNGWVPLGEDPLGNLRFAILPAVALALMEAAVYYRLLRTDVISTLNETFVLFARSRGLDKRYILARHVLRPSMFSLTTVMGLSLGRLLGGALIVEALFALPGLGTLLLQSVPSRDIPMIQGIVVVMALIYVVINIAVDLGYSLIDPRIRVRRSA